MYGRARHIHMVGIGGIGMSGIAELLVNLGHVVSGSDLKASETTRRLESLGVRVHYGHIPEHIQGADAVVISSAVSRDNPEVSAAGQKLIPVIPRAEMLAELMRLKYGVAVAGSHGKTTTTSILAWLMAQVGMDPTVVVGGKLNALGTNSRLGKGDFLVAEADESDGSFNRLSPVLVIVTNVDREHMDYYGSEQAVDEAFVEFMNKVPFYGASVVCLEDRRLAGLLPRLRKRCLTYGFSSQADFQARHVHPAKGGGEFILATQGRELGLVRVPLPGRHFILNTLGALAAAGELGVDMASAMAACADFPGVKRRFEYKGHTAQGAIVMDDYAHHPSEIKATLEAAAERWPDSRLVVCFQPHRYSRTADLFEVFAQSFYQADELLILDIYSAGENPREGISSQTLAQAVQAHGHRRVTYWGGREEAAAYLRRTLGSQDVLFTLGAGDVWRLSEDLAEDLN